MAIGFFNRSAATRTRCRSGRLACAAVWLIALVASGCSNFARTPPSPELQAILVNVSARYLNAVALGDVRQVATLALWPEYEARGHAGLRRSDVEAILVTIHNMNLAPEENPLYDLKVEDVAVDEDSATVSYLKSLKTGSTARIKVKLAWSGNAWLVTDDNLFGDDGYMSGMLRAKSHY